MESCCQVSAKLGKDQTSEPELQAVDRDGDAEGGRAERCAGELEPTWRAAAELGKDQTSERPELQAIDPDVKPG